MKKHFRATEYFTTATEPVELDSDMFPEFEGTTEQEFFDYISENYNELAEDESLPEEVRDLLGHLLMVKSLTTLTLVPKGMKVIFKWVNAQLEIF
jgi:hypothetical protein